MISYWRCLTLLLCVTKSYSKQSFIIETSGEHDDIETGIFPIFSNNSSGDYSLQRDCKGVGMVCSVGKGRRDKIKEDDCIFM